MLIGVYPTPVQRIESLGLWVKRDDLTNPLYGGNKVRKLDHLVPEALRRGKRRIVTVGALGSHHVLATAIHAGRAGLAVEAAVVPQRRSDHVEQNARADLACGARLHPARTYAGAALAMLARAGRDAYLVPMGGSNLVGSLGYVEAAQELAFQVTSGELPEPDAIVVTVGSGGTAAGLAAGLALAGMHTRVVGVVVASPVWFVTAWTRRVARRLYARAGGRDPSALRLSWVTSELGDGYGEPTESGLRAVAIAGEVGLTLDLTYTAKAFAGALALVATRRFERVLYWHTLSAAPAPTNDAPVLPPALASLLRPGRDERREP